MQAVRLDEETRGNYMTLQEMIDIEKAEARRDGLAEGLAEGRVEGLAEGRAERQDEIARLLGYSPEDFERFLREKKESQSSCEKD